MSKIVYLEKSGIRVVPTSGGFDIVKVSTGDILQHLDRLHEAEEFLDKVSPKDKESLKDILEPAAEISRYD